MERGQFIGVGTETTDVPYSCPTIPTLSELLTATDPDQFVAKYTDIAVINLTCALGLPGSDEIDIPNYLALLDRMAEAVRVQTERSQRLFDVKPDEFKHSRNVFRCLMLERVLRVQFKVHYNPLRTNYPRLASGRLDPNKPWTDDSRDCFIHGILSERRTGTCSSLPVCCIAVGRRIGYPLKLVRVPEHCLYRWDDGTEKFNIQNTTRDAEIRSDESYYESPLKWTQSMHALNARTKVWLHALTPRQEVSKFLCNRAIELRHAARYDEALQAVHAAERFDFDNPQVEDVRVSIHLKQTAGVMLPPALATPFFPQLISVVGTGPLSMPIEPDADVLLNAIDPFRDRAKDPKHLHVRVTKVQDDRHRPPFASPIFSLLPE